MTNTGIAYELFVQKLMQAIIDSESISGQRNIKVRHNEKIADKFGLERQFDVLWDYEQGGIVYNTIIECKDYNTAVSVEKIDALIGKLADFPTVRGIIATTKGYQSGAREKARNNGIEILCVRQQNDSDWVDENGQSLVRKVVLDLTVLSVPQIIKCETFVDAQYIQENNIELQNVDISYSPNNEVFIEDKATNETYSLCQLQQKLKNKEDTYGLHEKDIEFENAYLVKGQVRLKLKKLHILYNVTQPFTETIEIDAADYIEGVVEYLNQGKKKTVFKTPFQGVTVRDDLLPNEQLENNS